MKYFLDTSSLIKMVGEEFLLSEDIYLSSVTLTELENIKNSFYKTETLKIQVRNTIKYIKEYNPVVIIHREAYEEPLRTAGIEINEDAKILSDALYVDSLYPDDVTFVTDDLSLYNIANIFFGDDSIQSSNDLCKEVEEYTGYKEYVMTDDSLSWFYTNQKKFAEQELLINQYAIIRNSDNEIIDAVCRDENGLRPLNYKKFSSTIFGDIAPYNGDIYQKLAFDSLLNNKFTMLRGVAGSAKSLLALSYLAFALENHIIDKIIVFCNPVATAGSARLGFYPGERDLKLLDSQIGNFLSSKFGDRSYVERWIAEGKLLLLPYSDIRGFDSTGMNAGIYVTEAQNLDRNLMKLGLQRIGEDCIAIIEGDDTAQVDLPQYAGDNNGMKRVSKVFRGSDFYGEIKLVNCYRSRIASIAEKI